METATCFNYDELGLSLKHTIRVETAIKHLLEALRDELVSGTSQSAVVEMEISDAGRCVYEPDLLGNVTRFKWRTLFDDLRRTAWLKGREYYAWRIVRRVIARRQPINAPVRLYSFDGSLLPWVYWITGTTGRAFTGSAAIIRPATGEIAAAPLFVDLAELCPAYDQPMRF